jgi:hypothetical protein
MNNFTRNALGCLLALLISGTALAQTQQKTAQPSDTVTSSVPAPGGSNISGVGSSNSVAKWLDSVGTLGDSIIYETSGKIGIGTTTPREGLTIFSAGGASRYIMSEWGSGGSVAIGGDNSIGPFLLSHTDSAGTATGNYSASRVRFGAGGFGFDTSPATAVGQVRSWTTQATIDSSGRMGLGTTSPTTKLHVVGNVRISGTGNGLVFPDGTILTTAPVAAPAGMTSVTHDTTLTGTGASGSPLGLSDGAVTLGKLSAAPTTSGQVLTYNGTGLAWETPAAGGSSPTVFRHTRTVASKCGPFDDFSYVDHPLLNGNPDAMIFVTALVGLNDTRTFTNSNANLVVTYSGSTAFDTCPAERWLIRGGDVTDGAQFNVMVVAQ